jgi:FdrA protein
VVTRVHVEPNAYFDSVALMAVAARVNRLPGIDLAALLMGTSLNLELLRDSGLWEPSLAQVSPNDLVVAVRAVDQAAAGEAVQRAIEELRRHAVTPEAEARVGTRPRSLRTALRQLPAADLVVISVPGPFAALEAEEALRAGRHVFLFSDNVTLEHEVRLKRLARDRGLLLMGPDCGTALVAGLGLGFANVVRRGPVGIVAAAGTGLQQVASLVDWFGGGVSHGIGTGGRDLDAAVGGLTMTAGIDALAADPETKVLVLVSKPPAPEVATRVLEHAASTGKPVVATFIGRPVAAVAGITQAGDLTEAARLAVQWATGQAAELPGAAERYRQLSEARARLGAGQRYLRGLYSGGTLCDEAIALLTPVVGPIWSNIPLDPAYRLSDARRSREHTVVDLGAAEFTVGRPHPMIDQTLRLERLAREASDPSVAAILLDVVLGYGAQADPAGELAPAIASARAAAAAEGRSLVVVVALVGTLADPQGYERQRAALEGAGAIVTPSNAEAARLAASFVARVGVRGNER